MPHRLRGLPCVGSDICLCAFCHEGAPGTRDGNGGAAPARPATSGSADASTECRPVHPRTSSAAPSRDRRNRRAMSTSCVRVPSLVNLCLEQLSHWLPELLEEEGDDQQEGVEASVQLSLFASLLPSSIKVRAARGVEPRQSFESNELSHGSSVGGSLAFTAAPLLMFSTSLCLCCSFQQTLAALARRQFLLSDALLLNGLLDASWTLLDVSHSLVSDATLRFAAAECSRLQAVDVR